METKDKENGGRGTGMEARVQNSESFVVQEGRKKRWRRQEEKNSGGHLFELTVSQNLRSLCQGVDFKGAVGSWRHCCFVSWGILLKAVKAL